METGKLRWATYRFDPYDRHNLFHDRRARANIDLHVWRDKLVTLGHASVEWVMGRNFTPDTVLRDGRQKYSRL